ncbi:tRNA 2-selenouridine synthase [Campylobacter armoricus]|uniref:tRNA 2-selenouridine synthase n=1 Tax=Campylobacter armoricus TaxID=2505970 RepID=UPI001F3D4ADD|nr:tRNA 2-selenouridine synthase [Campylobacter armoricus]
MKITMIILSLLSLVLSACAFKENKASELETLANNYGGIYIFDKKIREEILEIEEKREEFRSKYLGSEIKVGNETHFVNFSYLKKKFPQILSNGCKYYRNDYNYKIGESNFNFKDKPEFAYYEDQFKAYMGEENYKKLRPYLGMTTYYVCEGKKYPVVFSTRFMYSKKSYGLFGDEGRGFSFSSTRYTGVGGGSFHYFIDGKFIKSDEEYNLERY